MKREIKFKSYIRNKDTGKIKSAIWLPFPNGGYEGDGGEILKTSEEIVDYGLQFTGLKDKNGKEIYDGEYAEGHIVRADQVITIKGIVEFVPELAKFVLKYKSPRGWDLHMDLSVFHEIISLGNIHENPDLIC